MQILVSMKQAAKNAQIKDILAHKIPHLFFENLFLSLLKQQGFLKWKNYVPVHFSPSLSHVV